jgi:hypothetical protein
MNPTWARPGNEAIVVGPRISAIKSPAIHRGVTHKVADRTLPLEASVIEVLAILDGNSVPATITSRL